MDRTIWLAIFVTVLFILTYDPKSKTLEKYIVVEQPVRKEQSKKLCCGSNDYRADNPVQCEHAYYQSLQFADSQVSCPARQPTVVNGAIVAQGAPQDVIDRAIIGS